MLFIDDTKANKRTGGREMIKQLKCRNCSTELKAKYHFRGCGYIDKGYNEHPKKEIDFYYCSECGLVYYFKERIK